MSKPTFNRQRRGFVAGLVGLALVAVSMGVSSCSERPNGQATSQQSVHARVIKSGTIRASYADYPPYAIKDAKNGQLSGIYVDTLNEIGKRLNLKVVWAEEVGWGAIFESLNSNRVDIFGAGIWRNSTRGKVGDFSLPVIYNVIKVFGRPDGRTVTDLSEINRPDVKIATLDGAIEDVIAKSDFPSAQRVSIPQLNPWSDVLLNITSKKADLTFAEPAAVNLYLEKNPGTLKPLLDGKSVRVFANAYAFKLGEPEFKAMIDSAIQEMQNDGTIERIIRKYEKHPGEFLRVAPGYVEAPVER